MNGSNVDDLSLFALIAEHGGLSAAMRAADVPKSNLSRALDRLEGSAGVPLFDRLPRGLKLTSAGAQLLPTAKMAARVANDAKEILRGASNHPSGPLRIAASTTIARGTIAPAMADFVRRWPDVKPEIYINHFDIDPIADDFDIFIRIGRPQQPYLVAKKIFELEMLLWTTKSYLGERSIDDVEAIKSMKRVVTDSVMIPSEWELRHKQSGEQMFFDSEPGARVGEPGTAYKMVQAGFGYTLLPPNIAFPARKSDQLLRLLPGWRGRQVEFFAVLPPHRTDVPAVRKFLDYLAEYLK